jgi:hypothetical protein
VYRALVKEETPKKDVSFLYEQKRQMQEHLNNHIDLNIDNNRFSSINNQSRHVIPLTTLTMLSRLTSSACYYYGGGVVATR